MTSIPVNVLCGKKVGGEGKSPGRVPLCISELWYCNSLAEAGAQKQRDLGEYESSEPYRNLREGFDLHNPFLLQSERARRLTSELQK